MILLRLIISYLFEFIHFKLLKAILGEGFGTFLFLFIVEAIVVNNGRQSQPENLVLGAISTAFCSIALGYAFADVSGAHFNPAVTFAVMITGRTTVRKGLCYIAIQCIASIFSTLALLIVFPRPSTETDSIHSIPSYVVIDINASAKYHHAFFMEMMLTFMLVYVIFAAAFDTLENHHTAVDLQHQLTIYTTTGHTKAGYAPVAIGFMVGSLCLLGRSVSGGAFNPARVFGPAIVSGTLNHLELYWIADFLGAAMAGLAQHLLKKK
jgi:glycerol uptake facilitator-like aquaporin